MSTIVRIPTPLRTLTGGQDEVSADGRTVVLEIPGIAPTRCMEITYRIKGATGESVEGAINNTIHQLAGGEKRVDRIR